MRASSVLALLLTAAYLGFMPDAPAQQSPPPPDWRTKAEATDYRETDRYPETVAYCQRLAAASPLVHIEIIGRSPEGRDIPALVVSSDGAFTPEAARATGKEILLVNACIHAGECEGKDAGLALIRDLVITHEAATAGLLDHAILLFVPIHSVDGHERFGPYNRINQHGPAAMGWRTTAQNYNLNRDWLKADAPEMRAMLGFFHRWMPDLFVDVHTTDGADFQYDLTYTLERHGNLPPAIRDWQKTAFDGTIIPALEKQGHLLAPYIVLRKHTDPKEGFNDGATAPRFSTGYMALWNRPALLLETHMLKDYRTRVRGTYDLLVQILAYFRDHPGTLRAVTAAADRETIAAGKTSDPARKVPVEFKLGTGSVPFEFRGVEYQEEPSAISGAPWIQYDPTKPVTFTVPFYNEVTPGKEVVPPLGYVIPAAWTVIIERLRAHGIAYTTLSQPVTLDVETYVLDAPDWEARPFENHHQLKSVQARPVKRRVEYPAGSVVVYLDQPGARVVVHLLEPDSPDSLLRWGYLDAVFEQKEYAEDYAAEELVRRLDKDAPEPMNEFRRKLASDPAFAGDPEARLNFFYRHSKYEDERLNVHPVGRIFERVVP